MNPSLYTRPNKPRTIEVTRRRNLNAVAPTLDVPEPVVVDSVTECHVTPPDPAARMVDYLGPVGDYMTLEPQGGTGNLVHALYEAGHPSYELTVVERNVALCNVIRNRFTGDQYINPIQECFLEYAERAKGKIEFSRIIMNPPFRKIKAHMNAALSLLGRDGHDIARLVALVPITYKHPDMEEIEFLPRDTFSHINVSTKIISIEN